MSEDIQAETSLEPEVEAQEVEANEYDDVNEVAENDGSEESEDQPEAVDDSEEIEFNQKQYKLPKDIASAVKDMQKDYTVKTQAVAEQRKAFEAQVQFHQQNIQDVAQYTALDNQLKEFAKVDLIALSAEDPVRAQQLSFYRQQLESQRNELGQTISQKNQQVALEKQQEIAKRIEESESVLRRDIKDWSTQLETNLQQFASSKLGFDIQDVKDSKADPRLYKLLHMAYIGDQIIQKQTAKPKVVQAQPVTTLSTKGAKVSRDPANMSDAEFAKWRQSFKKRSNS